MTDDVRTGKHQPARADIPRAGTTSGTDTPLPPACAIATCHHREHQLTQTKLVAVPYEEPTGISYKGGWCAPSTYVQHIINGRTHKGILTACRKWWQLWKPKCTSWVDDIPCYEPECELPHDYTSWTETLLDLPEVSIKRGGIRFPMNEERA